MTYRSVEHPTIQKAFVLAHWAATHAPEIGNKERKYFRSIARLIWTACGETGPMPDQLPTAPAEVPEAASHGTGNAPAKRFPHA